jgi:hypothetical protein
VLSEVIPPCSLKSSLRALGSHPSMLSEVIPPCSLKSSLRLNWGQTQYYVCTY